MSRRKYVALCALVFLLGAVGVFSGFAVKHLWQDHAALHELALIESLRIQRSQQQARPTDDAAGK